MAPMYCTIADVKNNVSGTDDGTGTCAQLADPPLSAAISQASNKISAYVGSDYETDAATPVVVVPPLVKTLTIQLATYYATLTYRKGKDLSSFDPAYLAYLDVMATLKDISSGVISIDPTPPGDPVSSRGHVVNTVPRCLTPADSGTVVTSCGVEPEGAPGSNLLDPYSWS